MWTLSVPVVAQFAERGRVMVLATEGQGTGPQPSCAVWAADPLPGLSQMEAIRANNALLATLPAEAVAAVDEFDPDRRAVVLGSFLLESETVAGRPALFHRRAAWLALEDKTVVDELWQRAGIGTVPFEVVSLYDAWAAANRLDRGAGTVWSMDATGGWHGGATGVRWVTSTEEADEVLVEWRDHTSVVRVMPFIEGIPCSIHGIVCPDGVVALRPVEMVTLRRGHRFQYSGCATFWDPPPDVREEMRLVARRVGAVLRREADFAGAFTVDGVVGADGFRPTELNPRAGAGLAILGRGMGAGYPLVLLCGLVAGGHDIGISALDWEAEVLTIADTVRSGGTWTFGQPARTSVEQISLTYHGGRWVEGSLEAAEHRAADHRAADARRRPVGTADVNNAIARCIFDPATWPVGPSVAPAAAAFFAWADHRCGSDFGPLAPAPEIRVR